MDQCAQCGADLTDVSDNPQHSDIEKNLLSCTLGELLAHDYVVVSPELSVRETVHQLNKSGHHCAVVIEKDVVVGIFTERDVLRKLAQDFSTAMENSTSCWPAEKEGSPVTSTATNSWAPFR